MPLTTCPACGHQCSLAAPACPHCGHPSPGAQFREGQPDLNVVRGVALTGSIVGALILAAPIALFIQGCHWLVAVYYGWPIPGFWAGFIACYVATLVVTVLWAWVSGTLGLSPP